VHGQEKHTSVRLHGLEALRGCDAVATGHADVHQHNVGLERASLAQDLLPIGRFAYYIEIALSAQQSA